MLFDQDNKCDYNKINFIDQLCRRKLNLYFRYVTRPLGAQYMQIRFDFKVMRIPGA